MSMPTLASAGWWLDDGKNGENVQRVMYDDRAMEGGTSSVSSLVDQKRKMSGWFVSAKKMQGRPDDPLFFPSR
jgi:hypothetical protein